jgi:hypothetical protein
MALPAGPANEADIFRQAQSFNSPLMVFAAEVGAALGKVENLDLGGTDLVATAVLCRDDGPCIRFFEAAGREHLICELEAKVGRAIRLTDLEGNNVQVVNPYRIGYLRPT